MSIEELEKQAEQKAETPQVDKKKQLEELTQKLKELIAEKPEEAVQQIPKVIREICSDFVMTFQKFREGDQNLIVNYLEQTLSVMRDFIAKYTRELEAQALYRAKATVVLDDLQAALRKYM